LLNIKEIDHDLLVSPNKEIQNHKIVAPNSFKNSKKKDNGDNSDLDQIINKIIKMRLKQNNNNNNNID